MGVPASKITRKIELHPIPLSAEVDTYTIAVPKVLWSSSNTQVATVDENGKISVIRPGKAKIIATSKEFPSVSSYVTIKAHTVEGLNVKKSIQKIPVGGSFQMVVSAEPSEYVTDKTVLWVSSNPEIAEIDETGKITGKDNGVVIITATSKENPEVKKTFEIKVGYGNVPPTPEKLANPLKVTVTNPTTVKTSKKKQTIKSSRVFTVSNAQGKVTFSKKSGAAALSIKPNGNIVVAKNTKKGTYKMKVAVNAAGNSKYDSVTKIVTVKVKVKK